MGVHLTIPLLGAATTLDSLYLCILAAETKEDTT